MIPSPDDIRHTKGCPRSLKSTFIQEDYPGRATYTWRCLECGATAKLELMTPVEAVASAL